MSVDSPEPRQRTVAELLAANGGSQTGRRRRRRASDDGDGPVPGAPEAPAGPAPRGPGPADQDRAGPPAGWPGDASAPGEHPSFPSRRPGGPGPFAANGNGIGNGTAPHGAAPNGRPGYGAPNGGPYGPPSNGHGPHDAPNGAGAYGAPAAPGPYGAAPDAARPQAFVPHGRPAPNGAPPPAGPERSGRPDRSPDPGGDPRGGHDDFAGADEIPTSRMSARRPAPTDDGGPPTQFGAPPLTGDGGPPTGAYDAFADDPDDDPRHDGGRTGVLPAPGRPGADDDGYDDGYGDDPHGDLLEHEDEAPDDDGPDGPARARSGRRSREAEPPAGLEDAADSAGAAGTGQGWAVVIAQWIGGAVAGAAIWVLFRFLWFSLPIVALALAVVLTVGLVLGVRALLRNDDLRTTLFAVLVGLLLTVSPAILVLLDR